MTEFYSGDDLSSLPLTKEELALSKSFAMMTNGIGIGSFVNGRALFLRRSFFLSAATLSPGSSWAGIVGSWKLVPVMER